MMIAQGNAIIAHGEEMAQDVVALRESGELPFKLTERLTADADALVAAGERLKDDGAGMRDYAERMLRSLGQ